MTENSLVERLRGRYRVPIADGLGPVGGGEPDNPNEFVRTFPTPPIQHEAAAALEASATTIAELRGQVERLTGELRVLQRESEKGFDALSDIDEAWYAFGTGGNRKALTLAEQISSQGRELDDALDKLAAAERALASKDGVQVKALEWDNLGYAHVPFEGRYYVGVYRPGQWEMRSPGMEDSTFPDGLFGSEEAAKAAAQAHFEAVIRSALTTPPPAQDAPVGGETTTSCAHCNDTGLVAIRSSDGRYLRPGPVPEDARGVAEGHCFECLAYPGGFDGPTGAE